MVIIAFSCALSITQGLQTQTILLNCFCYEGYLQGETTLETRSHAAITNIAKHY